MSHRFSGTMRFADGSEAPVELSVGDDILTLEAKGAELGSWPLKYCRVLGSDEGVFSLSIDGDEVEFAPEDPYRFGLTAAQHFEATALADRIKVIREIPPPTPDGELPPEPSTARPRLRLGFALSAVIAAGVIIAGVLAWSSQGPGPDAGPGAVPESLVTTVPAADVFDEPLVMFVDTWNRTAAEFEAPLRIVGVTGEEPFEVQLSDHLLLQTTTDADGSLQRFVLTADPSGGPEETQLTLAAWGTAIAVADPGLDRRDRRELLAELGIDLDDPELAGLEGEVETDRARYTLSYLHDFQRVLFTVAEP